MSADVARANYDLFVGEVLPVLQAHDVGGDIGVRYGEGPSVAEAGAGDVA